MSARADAEDEVKPGEQSARDRFRLEQAALLINEDARVRRRKLDSADVCRQAGSFAEHLREAEEVRDYLLDVRCRLADGDRKEVQWSGRGSTGDPSRG
jgi:hypothetical protein